MPSSLESTIERTEKMTTHEILWDDEDEDDNDLPAHTVSIGGVRSAHTSIATSQQFSKQGRKISGSKRVAKYRETQGYCNGDTVSGGMNANHDNVEVLQSITANPALQHSSFEELRIECYAQSQIAKGARPRPVDSVSTPWAVIPPMFNAYKTLADKEEDADLLLSAVGVAGP